MVKHLKIVAKCCLNWNFFTMPSIVVLYTQIQNMKTISSNLIIQSTTQKVIANFGFGRKSQDLKYFEVGFFSIFLEFILNSRTPLQRCIEKNQYNINLSCFIQIIGYYVFNMSTCKLLVTLSRIPKKKSLKKPAL